MKLLGRIVLFLSASLLLAASAPAETPPPADSVRAADLNGGALTAETLRAALRAIGSERRALRLTPGTWKIDSDLTLPRNVAFEAAAGAVLEVPAGKTLRLEGPFSAGLFPVFAGDGDVRFADGAVTAVYPQWWGAAADGATDSTSAINRAIRSLDRGRVLLPAGAYRITGTIELKDNVSLTGQEGLASTGPGSPVVLNYHGKGSAVRCLKEGTPYVGTFSGIELKNLYVFDADGTGARGFDLQGFRWCRAEGLAVNGFEVGFYTKHSWYARFAQIQVAGSRKYGFHAESSDNNTRYEKCRVARLAEGGTTGALFAYASNLSVVDFDSETNTDGVEFRHCQALNVDGFYHENTGKAARFAILVNASKGSVLKGVYVNGNERTERGLYFYESESSLVLGGAILNVTQFPTYGVGPTDTVLGLWAPGKGAR